MSMCPMLAVCVLLGAAGNQGANTTVEDVLTAPRWEIAPEVSFFRYEEPHVMKNKGVLYGVAGAYARQRGDQLFRMEAEFAFGTVDYEGALMDGTPYTMEDSRDYLLNLRLLWGQQGEPEDSWDRRFYAGIGYRGLNDDSTQDSAGYDRQSNYLYLPVGLKTCHTLGGHWQIELGGEFDMLLIGVQLSVLDDETVTNVQWPGLGGRASVELRHRAAAADLALAPFVQYWWVDDSNISAGWYEPRNNSLQYGLSLIWRF